MVRSAAPPAPQAVNQAVGRPLFWWAEERGTQALSRVIFRLSVIKLVRNIIKLVRNLSEQDLSEQYIYTRKPLRSCPSKLHDAHPDAQRKHARASK